MAVTVEGLGAVDRLCGARLDLGIHLEEDSVQCLWERHVDPVHPNHCFIRLVAVVVPQPTWREDQIAFMHDDLLAFDRGISAVALHDETDRGWRMAVRPSHLAR